MLHQYCFKYMLGYKGKTGVHNCEGRQGVCKVISFNIFSSIKSTSFENIPIQLHILQFVAVRGKFLPLTHLFF